MAGLVPAIHVLTHDTAYLAELRALTRRSSLQRCTHPRKDVDGRDKPGHDAEGGRALFSYLSAYGDKPGHDGVRGPDEVELKGVHARLRGLWAPSGLRRRRTCGMSLPHDPADHP